VVEPFAIALACAFFPELALRASCGPEVRNAPDFQITYDLNAAFDRAAADDGVKVIILAGGDPRFSAGHEADGKKLGKDFPVVSSWGGFRNWELRATSSGSRRSTCRARAAGAIWARSPLRKCKAAASPAA
jgi:hypothetical protein